MQSIAVLSMLVTTVVTLTVGMRLLVMAGRTRQLPELLYGMAFVASGVGQAFAQVGQRAIWNEPGSLATALNTLCFALVVVGNLSLWIATSRVFRPGEAWASWLCWAGCAVTLVVYGVRIVDGDFATPALPTRGLLAHFVLRLLLLAWTCFEAFRWHALLKKRLVLGLSDPVVTNQILLWGVSGVGAWLGAFAITVSLFAIGVHPLEWMPALIVILLAVLLSASGMWCAFFPPAWLRARLEGGAPA